MAIESLSIGRKEENQGINEHGKLSASEFNDLVDKVNELVTNANKTVYLSEAEFEALEQSGLLQDDVEYNIFEA